MTLAITKNKVSGLFEVIEVGGIYDGYVHNSFQRRGNAENWIKQRLQRAKVAAEVKYCGHCLAEDLFVTMCQRHVEAL